MAEPVDDRLRWLQAELASHARIAPVLGLDFDRPVRSLGDGYPENTIALVGKITERLLKQLWEHHGVPGDPSGKALNDLIKDCRAYIRNTNVINALTDIQRLRNRSTHDGYDILKKTACSPCAASSTCSAGSPTLAWRRSPVTRRS